MCSASGKKKNKKMSLGRKKKKKELWMKKKGARTTPMWHAYYAHGDFGKLR